MKLPTYYISHGAGPWPWLQGPMRRSHDRLEQALLAMRERWGPTPRAVLLVTAHWEAPEFRISAQAAPGMLYDYRGFPPETYTVRHPAPGHPVVAEQVLKRLAAAGLPAALDHDRGYDHGTFVPMAVIDPQARIPIVQMSLHESFDPSLHVAAGAALESLREEGILILGSGSSLHSYHATNHEADAFDRSLSEIAASGTRALRSERLSRWLELPGARGAHPREDHLLPLMVATGAAGDDPGATLLVDPMFFGVGPLSNFAFGEHGGSAAIVTDGWPEAGSSVEV